MAEQRKILWQFLGDSKNLVAASKRGDRALGKTEKASYKARDGLTSLTRAAGALGLAMGAREIANWADDAVAMSEAAAITADSFDLTFGPAAVRLRKELDETRLTLGLSQQAFESTMLPLGQLATAFGLTRDEASDFSQELFVAAGDLAAFDGNLDDAEAALGAVQSALKGEFDPLEQFGVKLKQADITAQALTETGKGLATELTNQELAAATLTLILGQLGDETGALTDLMGSAQDQANRTTAEMADLQAQIGSLLAPAMLNAKQETLALVESLVALSDNSSSLMDKVSALGAAWDATAGQFTDSIADIREEFKIWADRILGVKDSIQRLKDTFDGFVGSVFQNPFRNWKLPGSISIPKLPSFNFPGFAAGGVVPGAPGTSQTITAHAGERVTPLGQAGGGGSPITINVTGFVGSEDALAQAVADAMTRYEATNGTRRSGIA